MALYKESKKNFTKIKSYLVWKKNLVNEKKALKQVDYILTISQGMAISFKNDHKLRYTPIVLKNIPEKQKKYENQKYFHKKFNLDSDIRVMIILGSIYHNNKQLNNLIDTIKNHPKVCLVFIGDTKKHDELEKISSDNYINQKIFS